MDRTLPVGNSLPYPSSPGTLLEFAFIKKEFVVRRSFLSLMAVVFVSLSLVVSQAQAGKTKGKGKAAGHEGGMVSALGLTADQQKKFEELHNNMGAISELEEKAQAAMTKVHEAMKGEATAEQLMALHKEALAAKNAVVEARFEHHLQVREILTPDQRQKFVDLHAGGEGQGHSCGGKAHSCGGTGHKCGGSAGDSCPHQKGEKASCGHGHH